MTFRLCFFRASEVASLIFSKSLQFQWFRYSHLTNQEEEQELTPPITNTNCHFLIFGSSGSEKTSFSKHYLDKTKPDYLVFERDENEFHEQNQFLSNYYN